MALVETAVWVTWRGFYLGQAWQVELPYFHATEMAVFPAEDAAYAVVAQHWDNLKPLISDECLLAELDVRATWQDSTKNNSFLLGVNEYGTKASEELMPPNTGINIFKIPDNLTINPPGAKPFGRGRVMFPGIVELDQSRGLVVPATQGLWSALGENLEELTVTISTVPQTFTLGMYRYDPITHSPTDTVFVQDTYAGQKIGTRNSRKR